MVDKIPIFEWFLSSGDVLITVDTTFDGVDIPAHLNRQDSIDFILGATPTPKLSTETGGVKVPMRFSGALYSCYFPWGSIVQMSSQDAVIQFRSAPFAKDVKPSRNMKKTKPNLRLVK